MAIIKLIIFRFLLALRGTILTISKFLVFIFFTGGVLMLVFNDFPKELLALKIMTLMMGIIFTLINWFYDYIIFYFKPENIEITLYR